MELGNSVGKLLGMIESVNEPGPTIELSQSKLGISGSKEGGRCKMIGNAHMAYKEWEFYKAKWAYGKS